MVTFRRDKVVQGRTGQVPSSVIPFHSRFNTSSPLKSGRTEATTTAPSSPVTATHPFAAIADGPCRSVRTYPSHCWAVQGTSSAQDFADSAPTILARALLLNLTCEAPQQTSDDAEIRAQCNAPRAVRKAFQCSPCTSPASGALATRAAVSV